MQSQYNEGFYTQEELKNLGFASIGKGVLISKLTRIYGASNISIGNNVRIDDFVILSGKIEIGSFVHIGAFASITGGKAGVKIGDFCGMSSQSKIFAVSDDFINGYLVGPCVPMQFRNVIEKPVILTKHCHIGSHSLVLPGSIFLLGACLGPMSLNMGRKLKEWSYYIGNPAKKVYDIDKKKITDLEIKLEY
ncbi:galactoside O-acetyltransferase [Helicobacter anseris]|uniref:Chloramphenicol acetyltransferase n=2 Tax=Helicobacter anseris TaxID=375926 RepID=A0A3D8J8T0_9HELI|nr:galactoside O-acetyltransferase [Helicobacter anseris]